MIKFKNKLIISIIFIILLLLCLFYIKYYNYLKKHYIDYTFDENTDIIIVSAHYNEDLDWLNNSKYPVVVCDKKGAGSINLISNKKCTMDINRGREASAFLKFIIEYYDKLPKKIAFIHGHETAYHQKYPDGILKAIENANIDKYGYISLNNELQSIILSNSKFERNHPSDIYRIDDGPHLEMKKVWSKLYEKELGYEFSNTLRYQRSAQFIVSREKIRSHPKQFYEDLYNYVIDPANDDYTTSVVLEFSWHMIFGEKPDMCDTDINDNLYNSCDNDTYLKTRFKSI